MSGTFNLSIPYLALTPKNPFTPGRGHLLFFKPDYVFPVFKSLDKDDSHTTMAEFPVNGMLWVDLKPAGSGKRYLLDFAVGSKQSSPVYRIQGPGGMQSITTSTGPQHILALYESTGSTEVFALESLGGGWDFYSVTMTEVH